MVRIVCPSGVHTACNSVYYLIRAAAVRIIVKRKSMQTVMCHILPLQPKSWKILQCHSLPVHQMPSNLFIYLLTCSHSPHESLTTFGSPLFLCYFILLVMRFVLCAASNPTLPPCQLVNQSVPVPAIPANTCLEAHFCAINHWAAPVCRFLLHLGNFPADQNSTWMIKSNILLYVCALR